MQEPQIKRILAATDLDECATRALEHAKVLSRQFEAEITMVHAVASYTPAEPFPVWIATDGDGAQQKAAHDAIDEYQRIHLTGFPASAPVLEAGDPATAILATSRSRESDVIVMGTHGRTGLERALLGSIAERVIHDSEKPVLTVRPGVSAGEPRFRRILCPVNYTSLAAKALRHALLLASAFEAELTVLHLIESDSGDIEAELDRLREWIGDVPMSTHASLLVHRGDPATQVNEYARQNEVDLLVLGAQRKKRGTRSVLGSTTDRVTRHAPCAVLTVPAASGLAELEAA
jgi:nucleotide-binding universal stress UspA family protein